MDNVNYNFDIVVNLISASISCELKDNKEYFYKPIILIMSSIVECILYDFFIRIPNATREGIPNLNEEDIDSIRDTKIPNKLASLIDTCKKHNILGKEENIYESLLRFARIRNRIHIQNEKDETPRDEARLWTVSLVKEYGELFAKVCLFICSQYPRPQRLHLKYIEPEPDSVAVAFPDPWKLII